MSSEDRFKHIDDIPIPETFEEIMRELTILANTLEGIEDGGIPEDHRAALVRRMDRLAYATDGAPR